MNESSTIAIKLIVDDRARFSRRGEPVTMGVSFPRGEVRSGEPWSLMDEGGTCSAGPDHDSRSMGDESVRWMLVEFQADVAADGGAGYSLVNRPKATRRVSTRTSSADGLTVDTGVARFIVPQSGTAAMTRAEIANQAVLNLIHRDS